MIVVNRKHFATASCKGGVILLTAATVSVFIDKSNKNKFDKARQRWVAGGNADKFI